MDDPATVRPARCSLENGRSPVAEAGGEDRNAMPQLEAQVLELVQAVTREFRRGETAEVTPDSNLETDLGLDSLSRLELSQRIEHALGTRLDDSVLGARRVRDLVSAVRSLPRQPPVAGGLPAARLPAAHGSDAPRQAGTLMEVLEWHAQRSADRMHVLLVEGDSAGGALDYGRLHEEARSVAGGLLRMGMRPGDFVALMLPTSHDYFRAFYGVLFAGGVPVPLYPPSRWTQLEAHLQRQVHILRNCRATVLISSPEVRMAARLLSLQCPDLRQLAVVGDLHGDAAPVAPAMRSPEDVALLQYTSGSTGQPKGVVLTHANLLANIRAMGAVAKVSDADVFVSWLPLYHDMGLIGAWLGSLYFATPLVLMPTQAFLARPARWLRAIDRYRGTLSAAPNFAYEMLATRVPTGELDGLDLSSWRIAFNGAEQVNASTLQRFAARFASSGFRPEAATPVYGLAEAALGLTFPPPGRLPRVLPAAGHGLAQVVSCGLPLPGSEVRTVDESGRETAERSEGRIQFRGPSATRGYFDNPAASRALLRDGWLDTGDVGFLAEGELYVTSRVKDLIIRAGHNIYPYAMEEAVGELPGIRKGCVAVFGAAQPQAGTERVVVLAECRLREVREREALRRRIEGLALDHLGVPADDIVLAAPHSVLKTSSGKIRRAACRELYESGRLAAEGSAPAAQLARVISWSFKGMLRTLAMKLARWLYAFRILAAVLAAAVPGALFMALPVSTELRRRAARRCARFALAASGVCVRVEGSMPDPLPVVTVCNHASYADSLILTALLPPGYAFVAKQELRTVPLLGWLLARLGTRFVERFDLQEAAAGSEQLNAAAAAGEPLLIFPEGTCSRAPGLAAFHLGAFVAAARSGRPIVPLALRGTRSLLRPGEWLPQRSPVVLHIGAPLVPAGGEWRDGLALRSRARIDMLAHCGEPDLEGHELPSHAPPDHTWHRKETRMRTDDSKKRHRLARGMAWAAGVLALLWSFIARGG